MNLRRISKSMKANARRALWGAAIFALSVPANPLGLAARVDDNDGRQGFDHVFIIMMENTGFNTLVGNPNAPFINFAAATTGVATNYFGVSHPSQPNYIAATSGSTNGVVNDNDITIDVPNIVDELESHGKSWKAYMQSFSLCATPLDKECGNQLYERKHNPFISYQDVQNNPARVANIVDFSQLATDLANNTVEDYVWISPDQCNDMHGRRHMQDEPDATCDFSRPELIPKGDTFLLNTVNAIMSSRAWTGNSIIFITWDESDFTGTGPGGFGDTSGCCNANPGGGHVLTIVISNRLRSARSSGNPFNHYSMMATIEDSWRLGCLANTCDRDSVKPMISLAGAPGL